MRGWDEFSEFLLENRVPTSADFNMYPIRIFLICFLPCSVGGTLFKYDSSKMILSHSISSDLSGQSNRPLQTLLKSTLKIEIHRIDIIV